MKARKSNNRSGHSKMNRKKAKLNLIKLAGGFVVFAAVIIIILSSNANLVKAKANSNDTEKYYKTITIQSGDSLWSIADKYMDPDEYIDEREYISEIKQINKLVADDITSGQKLIVSYYK